MRFLLLLFRRPWSYIVNKFTETFICFVAIWDWKWSQEIRYSPILQISFTKSGKSTQLSGYSNLLWCLSGTKQNRTSHYSGIFCLIFFTNHLFKIGCQKTIKPSDITYVLSLRRGSQTTFTRFLLVLTTYPPALTFSMVWKFTKSGHFWTTYLPRLVNVWIT